MLKQTICNRGSRSNIYIQSGFQEYFFDHLRRASRVYFGNYYDNNENSVAEFLVETGYMINELREKTKIIFLFNICHYFLIQLYVCVTKFAVHLPYVFYIKIIQNFINFFSVKKQSSVLKVIQAVQYTIHALAIGVKSKNSNKGTSILLSLHFNIGNEFESF